MHELPLLVFTLFLQGSVGVTLWLAFGPKLEVGALVVRQRVFPIAATAFVLACIGLLASTLHMGYPLNALNALRHVSSSWLSREIVFASLYLAFLGLASLLLLVKKPGWKALLVVAALLGAVDVFCMAQIYIHTSVVTWQHMNTLILFFGSVGIIGSVIIALAYMNNAHLRKTVTLRVAAAVVMLVVLIRLIVQPVWLADIAAADASVVTLPHQPLLMLQQMQSFHLLSVCLSVMGMLGFVLAMFRHNRLGIVASSIVLVIGEVMLRYVFFSIG